LDHWRSTPPRNGPQEEQKTNVQSGGSPPRLLCEFKIGGNAGTPLTRAENPEGKKVKKFNFLKLF
jgi:hypothetical protein